MQTSGQPHVRSKGAVIQQRIQNAVSEILDAIGTIPFGKGCGKPLTASPACTENFFPALVWNPADAIDAVFDEQHRDPVLLRNVTFYSVCEHHLLPFFGRAHLAYIPSGRVAGISKLARALEMAAHRPQVQERLTRQWADAVFSVLNPAGLVAQVQAEHMCMSMRGVRKPGSEMTTVAVRGRFEGVPFDSTGLLALLRE